MPNAPPRTATCICHAMRFAGSFWLRHWSFVIWHSLPSSARQHPHQVPHLLLNLIRAGNRMRDLFSEDVTEALAQAMHRHPRSPFGHLQLFGDLGVRSEEHTSELQSLRHLVCRLL